MAKGYFIREGDKTTCGGKVLEADTHITMFGFAQYMSLLSEPEHSG